MTKKTSTPTYPPLDAEQIEVVEDDEHDGDRPQPLDVRPEARVRRSERAGRTVTSSVGCADARTGSVRRFGAAGGTRVGDQSNMGGSHSAEGAIVRQWAVRTENITV